MIWKTKFEAKDLNLLNKDTMMEYLGIEFTKIGDDYLEATMPVDHRTKQPYGLLHGGASCVLSETLGSVASVMCTDNPITNKVVGIEINANHLKSAKSGIVTGVAKPIKIGRRIQVWQIDIFDDKKALVCSSRLTTMIIRE